MSQGPHILPSLPKMAREGHRETAPYEPVCALFRRYLHQEKLKFTPERAMILDAVLRKEGLFEPEQLIDGLKGLGHKVSRATVYRTLSHLQDAGILKQVFFDNKQSYYEVIAGRQTHDYLMCLEHGFEPLSHRFQIFGMSPEARAQKVAATMLPPGPPLG